MTVMSIATPAMAADYKGEMYIMDLPRAADSNKTGWGHGDIYYMGGWHMPASNKTVVYSVDDWEGNSCYCIEPGCTNANRGQGNTEGRGLLEQIPR